MAYDIFNLSHVTRVADGATFPLSAHPNGSHNPPTVGSMLIWDRSYDNTGHVAIVTRVTEDTVCIVEQNFDDMPWPKGQDFARSLRLREIDGLYFVEDEFKILGWCQIDEAAVDQQL